MSSAEITIFLGGGGFLVIAFLYLMFCGDIKEEAIEPEEATEEVEKEEPVVDSKAEEKKQSGKSFKQLK